MGIASQENGRNYSKTEVGESGFKCWVSLVILVLRECISNAPVVSLVLPAFENASSLGSPPHQVVYILVSMVPVWVTVSCFLAGNREAELKPTTFPCFPFFSLLLILTGILYF